jgi:hypothetical protein
MWLKLHPNRVFFKLLNHGVPSEVLESLKFEQMEVFHKPINKMVDHNFLNVLENSCYFCILMFSLTRCNFA